MIAPISGPQMPLPQPPRPIMGGHTLATRVDGDIRQLWDKIAWLTGVAFEIARVQDTLHAARAASLQAWDGRAADRARDKLGRDGATAGDLAAAARRVVQALTVFVYELEAVVESMAQARDLARSAGYRLTADTIQFPLPIVDPAATGPGRTITALVTAARRKEAAAHQAIQTDVAKEKTFFEAFLTPTRMLGVARGVFTTSMVTYLAKPAPAVGQFTAAELTARLNTAVAFADNTTGGLRHTALSQAFDLAPRIPAAELNAPLTLGPARLVGNDMPYAKAVLKPLHVPGGVLGLAGTGLSIMHGTPPTTAAAAGAGGWAAGAAASGLTEVLLTAATAARFGALAAGPIGWAAFVVGTAVSAGVGYAIEHHWSD
ncbi:hypothetical protein Amir_0580 [Actinosynnema mirum DSM 43827]|uniref:Uncharacterized protein n=1 Tax=Actinosynnema mirum (strain ATCC 29888 / DSM 43827 / JCM 3225 / NBRC 14064 / NCIMB 13271 / NRRL B-12336 / IMRU 3971 / 101) TaxID=446462 RepID=C6WJB4_ACTMD|nr:hypothetical protein Amir_0580 [Actinosynnema mirum DSM 43827]